LSNEASFVIIQDEGRAGLLARDDNLPPDKFVMVPNSPLGPVHRQRLDYWHRRFDLPRQKKVVIHAGNIDAWTGITEIADSVSGWPDDWVLVVHTRYAARQTKEFLDLQRRADPERIFFSTNPVSRMEYDELVDSADIGIAFYLVVKDSVSSQENIRTIGLSSGKVAYYLRSGLPVITNNTTSLSSFIREESCGVVVSNEQETGNAIREISSSYEKYRSNAYRCFENRLNFTGGFKNVIERIEAL
jgi:glycosyltransferase involved in cell wall biosynthesis